MIWNLSNTILGSVALLVAIVAAHYTRTQVILIRSERKRRELDAQELIEWSARANEVQQRLLPLMLRWNYGGDGTAAGPLYPMIINEPALRGLIEAHLVCFDIGRNRAEARTLTPELLRLPLVRNTIQRVEERFASARKESPTVAAKASL